MKLKEINKILKKEAKSLGDIKEKLNQRMIALEYDIITEVYGDDKKLREHQRENYMGVTLEMVANCLGAFENGGTIVSVKFKNGEQYAFVADYTKVPFELLDFDPKNTFPRDKPKCVPYLKLDDLINKSFVPDAIRIGEDKYLMTPKYYSASQSQYLNTFSILTLDQLVLTVDFYYNVAKTNALNDAVRKRDRNIEQYLTYDRSRRESTYRFTFRYNDLPAVNKKKITQSEWDNYNLEQKEAVSYPFKMMPKKVSTKFGKIGNSMPTSYHIMYENVVDPTATRNRGYANTTVFSYFRVFQAFLEWKILDFQHIRRSNAETNSKAYETSFGLSNTSKELLKDYNVLVKRQNGDTIAPVEVDDIRMAMGMIFQTFGDFRKVISKHQLVISHANKTHMYASKAIGLFIPRLPAIGVSRIGGIRQFYSTASHEFAHYLDFFTYEKGNWFNGWYESMNYESKAGQIAIAFREKMKTEGKASEYITSTVECFARAMQQYFTLKWFPDAEFGHFSMINIENPRIITNTPWYCSKENFEEHIAPLIEDWIKLKNFPNYDSKIKIETPTNLSSNVPSVSLSVAENQRTRNIRILQLKYKYTQ
jgi:hypothetical protein